MTNDHPAPYKNPTPDKRENNKNMSIGWIVAYSKPFRENYAAENLDRQSVQFYYPRIMEEKLIGRRGEKQLLAVCVPLFPRYIFIHIEHQWRHILSTYGIAGIILRSGEPAFCGDKMIAQMRAREDAEGLITLPSYQELANKGDRVKATAGLFENQIGIYDGMHSTNRVRVLFEYLGRKTLVLIDPVDLQKAA